MPTGRTHALPSGVASHLLVELFVPPLRKDARPPEYLDNWKATYCLVFIQDLKFQRHLHTTMQHEESTDNYATVTVRTYTNSYGRGDATPTRQSDKLRVIYRAFDVRKPGRHFAFDTLHLPALPFPRVSYHVNHAKRKRRNPGDLIAIHTGYTQKDVEASWSINADISVFDHHEVVPLPVHVTSTPRIPLLKQLYLENGRVPIVAEGATNTHIGLVPLKEFASRPSFCVKYGKSVISKISSDHFPWCLAASRFAGPSEQQAGIPPICPCMLFFCCCCLLTCGLYRRECVQKTARSSSCTSQWRNRSRWMLEVGRSLLSPRPATLVFASPRQPKPTCHTTFLWRMKPKNGKSPGSCCWRLHRSSVGRLPQEPRCRVLSHGTQRGSCLVVIQPNMYCAARLLRYRARIMMLWRRNISSMLLTRFVIGWGHD